MTGVLALALALLAFQGRTDAQLSLCVDEGGQISMSVDGNGNNDAGGGLLAFDKPAGATVRAAYLAAASNFTRIIDNGDIVLNGQPVSWDKEYFNGTDITVDFFHNVFADVTSLVAATIDAAPDGAGTIAFEEVESTGTIDGVAFAVIFDDPNVVPRLIRNAKIYFGGASVFGDTFNITLAEPVDLGIPDRQLKLGLGISFGVQGISNGEQAAEVRVNGSKISRSAGGEDDGNGDPSMGGGNGALLTVGGIGDSIALPLDPCGDATMGFATDDELYDLLPFYVPGSTSLSVETMDTTVSPGGDDNIFWATVCSSTASGFTEDITLGPLEATNIENDVHTVTATVMDSDGDPVVDRPVTFSVLSGPNVGDGAVVNTDADGLAEFSYTGDDGPGEDCIEASFVDSLQLTRISNPVKKIWQEQCVLVVGDGLTPGTFTPSDHTFVTAVGTVQGFSPVLLTNIAEWTIPLNDPIFKEQTSGTLRRRGGPKPTLVSAFSAQVLLWNPIDFPSDPEKVSNTLLIRVYSDGQVFAFSYGGTSQIALDCESEFVPGGVGSQDSIRVRFPFVIQGF